MPTLLSSPPKPISQAWRPELTRLPRLHSLRRAFRNFVRILARILIRLLTRSMICGLEHFPLNSPALIAINHLGDADAALLLTALPVAPDALGKIELHDFPILGKLMDWYGIIWLHRGRPDRRALRCALEALAQGRCVLVAPEGRYTLTGGLEEGGHGAALLALMASVPVVPVTLTGTENEHVYGSLWHLKRAQVTLTVGQPFRLVESGSTRESLQRGTGQIMRALAMQLPPEYRGAYGSSTNRAG